jgi:hypothetical protein
VSTASGMAMPNQANRRTRSNFILGACCPGQGSGLSLFCGAATGDSAGPCPRLIAPSRHPLKLRVARSPLLGSGDGVGAGGATREIN